MNYDYTGDIQPTEKDLARGVQPYLPDPKLVRALHLAINLGRPLLLQGEPGCGKTQLAFHLAYELGRLNDLPEGEDWPLETWSVKSNSRAEDGMYRYDAVGRLSNAQLANLKLDKIKPVKDFVKFGALGNAIRKNKEGDDKRVIVLIDEIDKADIDFPNDLLWVLDKNEFTVPELAGTELEKISAEKERKPIVIITSNREKELPGPFLRRCFYHFIKFPGPDVLTDILAAHVPNLNEDLRKKAVERFIQIRDDIKAKTLHGRLPSTSELIDWAKAIKLYESDKDLLADVVAMEHDLKRTPHLNVLIKDHDQMASYQPEEKKAAN